MTLFVREYSWMWQRLGLSLAECRVYAYIHGLTHGDKGGYDGSKRHLAELLGLNAGAVKRILDSLKEKHLIVCTENVWQSVATDNTGSVATDNKNVATDNENVASNNSPHTPLYNNNKQDEKDMKPNPDFLKFKEAYINAAFNYHSGCYNGREGADNWFKYRGAFCEQKWSNMSEPKKKAILEELKKPDGFWKSNPEFLLSDFPEPQPHNYNGDKRIDDLLKAHKVASAEYNGKFGMYSLEDIELFHLRRPEK